MKPIKPKIVIILGRENEADVAMELLKKKLSDSTGVPIVVVNRELEAPILKELELIPQIEAIRNLKLFK